MGRPDLEQPPPPPALDPRAHRALGGESRLRLLRLLRDRGPLEADEIAAEVGLHLNTVRAHLTVLREAGLVTARTLSPAGRGRPRLAFAATASVPEDGNAGADRLLARILTGALLEHPDGARLAAAAGSSTGRHLVEAGGGPPRDPQQRRRRVIDLLERLGFAPDARAEQPVATPEVITLTRCPFSDLATSGSSVVCAVHRGILQGAFEAMGGGAEELRLIPFAAPGACAVHLDRTAPAGEEEARP